MPAKRGRPSLFTPELAARICERLSKGDPLTVICRGAGMPDPSTVWRWTEADQEFSQAIAQARARGFDAIADQCLVIANTPVEGVREEIDADGKKKLIREDMLGHRKLQIETRLKLLAKWDPKRYGDRLDLHHAGGLTLTTKHNLTDEQLEAIAAGGSAGAAGAAQGPGKP